MLYSSAPVDLLLKVRALIVEVARIKPWTLVFDFRVENHEPLVFRPWQVTANLELALRYLRREERAVTLWVDALCINQADDDEKKVHIRRMDWVYANASPVVVWLGGYHGIQEPHFGSGCTEGEECEHRRQIQSAFDLVWSLSGWRLTVPSHFTESNKSRYPDARRGLRDIHNRGWWERLWVIQEVALATGPVQMQCGHNVCELRHFWSAHYSIRLSYPSDNEMIQGSQSAERFRVVASTFSYSDMEDQPSNEQPFQELIGTSLKGLFNLFGYDVDNNETPFREQDFGARLQRILLRTAGQFRCCEDQDRFFAVLGIAVGARPGRNSQVRDLVRFASSYPTILAIALGLDRFSKLTSAGTILTSASMAFMLAYSAWSAFYESYARHWTVSRPEYVVIDDRPAAIEANTLDNLLRTSTRTRAEFFATLAADLATKTRTLAFLDAAQCGEDDDSHMPSWVPNWKRDVDERAYKFAIRKKRDGQAVDSFRFTNNGKALEVWGRPRGTVHVVRSTDPTSPPPTLIQRIFEQWLALPLELKKQIVDVFLIVCRFRLRAVTEFMRRSLERESHSKPALDDDEIRAIPEYQEYVHSAALAWLSLRTAPSSVGAKKLVEGGKTLVYSFDRRGRELGFLRVGEARRGDQIVFVPGCYHHLVLRRQDMQADFDSVGVCWKLVGLVAMGWAETRLAGCSEGEWARLRREKGLFKYCII
jgi:hypothetical protein